MINPVLLKFQSEWYGEVKIVGINVDKNFRLATSYRLTSLPTLILFEQGSIVERLDGILGRDDLRPTLNRIMVNRLPKTA
jgi:thioredoxin 1